MTKEEAGSDAKSVVPSSNDSPTKPDSTVSVVKHPLNVTLHGLQEMEQFSTDAEREAALKEIAAEAGDPTSWHFWLGVGILVGVVLAVMWGSAFLLRMVVLPRAVEEAIQWVTTGLAFFLAIRWLHRSGAKEELREKLLARGVPVCRACGYSLRGATPESTSCPECGEKIDARVAKMLATGPSSSIKIE